jgi:hypothetical protein
MGTTKSTTITGLDASPSVIPNAGDSHGRLMSKVESLETHGDDSAAHKYRFFRMNAQDRITDIGVQCDAVAGLTSVEVGLYDINDGDAVSVACYVAAVDWHTGLDTGTTAALNYRFSVPNIVDAKDKVWEDAGVSVDPGNVQYDLVLTNGGNVSEAETLTVTVEYVSGS